MNFLTGKDVLLKKDFLEKAVAIKRFELRKQIIVAEKQYQKLDKVFKSSKEEEKINKRSCAESNVVCNMDFTFYKYHNKEFAAKHSFDSKKVI